MTYYPVGSTASALTGPLWHNNFTSGVPWFGLHNVTTPNHMSDLYTQIRQSQQLTCMMTEMEDRIARVLSHHVTRSHVRAEIGDDSSGGSVLVVQTATLVLIWQGQYHHFDPMDLLPVTYRAGQQEVVRQELESQGLRVVFESVDLDTLLIIYIYITLLSHSEHRLIMQHTVRALVLCVSEISS